MYSQAYGPLKLSTLSISFSALSSIYAYLPPPGTTLCSLCMDAAAWAGCSGRTLHTNPTSLCQSSTLEAWYTPSSSFTHVMCRMSVWVQWWASMILDERILDHAMLDNYMCSCKTRRITNRLASTSRDAQVWFKFRLEGIHMYVPEQGWYWTNRLILGAYWNSISARYLVCGRRDMVLKPVDTLHLLNTR
jgi:hypothetical protein